MSMSERRVHVVFSTAGFKGGGKPCRKTSETAALRRGIQKASRTYPGSRPSHWCTSLGLLSIELPEPPSVAYAFAQFFNSRCCVRSKWFIISLHNSLLISNFLREVICCNIKDRSGSTKRFSWEFMIVEPEPIEGQPWGGFPRKMLKFAPLLSCQVKSRGLRSKAWHPNIQLTIRLPSWRFSCTVHSRLLSTVSH